MTFLLASSLDNGAGTVPNVNARNAEVEAFAMHLRQLIEFFWTEKQQTVARRNAFAADYFEPGAWRRRARPKRPPALGRAFHKRIGWGVAHLTYDRADPSGKDAWWGIRPHVLPLARVAECFLTNVESAQLAPGVHDEMTKCVSNFLATFPDLEKPEAD